MSADRVSLAADAFALQEWAVAVGHRIGTIINRLVPVRFKAKNGPAFAAPEELQALDLFALFVERAPAHHILLAGMIAEIPSTVQGDVQIVARYFSVSSLKIPFDLNQG